MLFSYLKAAYRHIFGSFLYSAINILGLSIGLAGCLLIVLYVRHELSYESQFANADRIYRVSREYFPTEGARLRIPAQANAPITPALLADYPQYIEQAGRIYGGGPSMILRIDDVSGVETEVRMADQSILRIFDFDVLAGDLNTALVEPGSIVLTESLAYKYFGNIESVGRTLGGMGRELKVTAVIRDIPDNTHLSVTGLISMNTLNPANLERWNANTDFFTYVLLQPNASIEPVVADVNAFLTRHIDAQAAAGSTLRFMPIRDIHLRSDRDEEWAEKPVGSAARVYTFIAIALSILLIACINFMSIATARSSLRAREVAMRKTLGSSHRELVMQFLAKLRCSLLCRSCWRQR